jgi:hypothetical protein
MVFKSLPGPAHAAPSYFVTIASTKHNTSLQSNPYLCQDPFPLLNSCFRYSSSDACQHPSAAKKPKSKSTEQETQMQSSVMKMAGTSEN